MGTFRKVAKTTDLEPGTATLVEIDGEKIALFNVAGELYAIDNTSRVPKQCWSIAA